MPPRKKTAVAKRKASTPIASSPTVQGEPPSSTVSPALEVEEATAPEADSLVGNDQARKLELITTEGSATDSLTNDTEEESSQADLSAVQTRRAKKRAVSKVAVSSAKKQAVGRDQSEEKSGYVSEKEVEVEKSEAFQCESDSVVRQLVKEHMEEVVEVNGEEEKEKVGEGEDSIEKIDEAKYVEELNEEVIRGGEKIVNIEYEELNSGDVVYKGDFEYKLMEVPNQAEPMEEVEEEPIEEEEVVEEEPIEEEVVEEEPVEEEPVEEEEEPVEEEEEEEEEPIEEEPVEEEEPVRREPIVEELLEEDLVVEEQHMGQEPIIEEPTEDEEEEEEEEEVEEEEEEDEEEEEEEEVEEEEEDEVEEEPVEEEMENNEEKKDTIAVKDVQPASLDGVGEDHGLGDEPEPSMYMKDLLPNSKVKEAQIFISQLEKTVVEEDISKVFARFGEIQSVRVIRHSLTQKSKGYAFLQYSTTEAAEKALSELKDGAEIKGKTVHISASNQENCTLFVGNICKSWSKDQVLDAFKGLDVEGIEHIALPEDPIVEGKIKGFAFVEFGTHIDAKAALNRLCKPDAVLGCDFSAKVSFAQLPVKYSEDLLAKVKTVYLEPVPASWDGKKIEEICKEYGAIEQIKLFRKSRSRRKRDFAFVEFVSRDGALGCVEGLNKALDGQDDTKMRASLAKPFIKNTGSKFMIRGNFKVKESNANVEIGEAAKVIKRSSDEVEKEVKIIEVSGETKKKHKKPILKQVIAQKAKALSPQKTIKKNKKAKVPDVKTPKEVPHRHVPNKRHAKEAAAPLQPQGSKKRPFKVAPAPVQPQGSKKRPFKEATTPVQPQGSKKRPFKDAPESSKRPTKGKMKHKKGMQGGPPPNQSGAKKSKPFKDRKQHQSDPAFNHERGFKRSRNMYHGDYHSHGSPIDRRPPVEYAYAPPEYTSRIHETSRHEPYAYAPGSYHSQRSDLAPHAGYVPPTRHVLRTRHVYEQSAPALPAPYGGVYERAIVYTREPPIPPTSHPVYATYPRYEQPSYPYSTGGSYPADYAPRRSYY